MTDQLQEKLSTLPSTPGVYFHKDKNGEIIYVGKAAVLKNRVRQYFQQSRNRDPKTEILVQNIVDVEWIEVDSEMDALFLEAELIKRYKPRFNLDLRDDKSDLFVKIDMKSNHPLVVFVRRPLDDGADYFGPFYSGFTVKKAMKYLRKIFPYDSKKPAGKKVSLDYHIGLSPGLEEGKTSLADYKANLRKLMMYLKGERTQLARSIELEMQKAAKDQKFEQAALLRNQMLSLKELNRQILFSDKEFMDISKDQALNGLADLLKLTSSPYRIEGYDISHMSGTNTTASMVVFTNGLPDKTEYKKFKMRVPGNDDFAHMREVMTRRFSGKHDDWPKPDLLLIDGGKGQLSSALSVLDEKGVTIPAIGLAKRYEEIIVRKEDGTYVAINLPNATSHIVKLLQRIRDESHRFAVSYHSTLKRKGQIASALDEVPGIGPATKKKLLKTFGSTRGIAGATNAELTAVVGPKKATVLLQYLKQFKPKEA